MQLIHPILKSTKHSEDLREWVPFSFDGFLAELEHITRSCEGNDPLPLFRGQEKSEWLLDSSLVRNSIKQIFGIPDYYELRKEVRQSVSFHRAMISIVLLKFGTVWNPSQEALDRERVDDIDPWFELLKNLQQYPEKDYFIKGTFLWDWTRSKDIALYFATYHDKDKMRAISPGHGALWVFDAVSTGKILQTIKVKKILSLMQGAEFINGNKTLPLLFHPARQTFQPRSVNQMPVYVAQMDYRYDVADVWAGFENHNKKRVFIKLILKEDLKGEASKYLDKREITESYVYPE